MVQFLAISFDVTLPPCGQTPTALIFNTIWVLNFLDLKQGSNLNSFQIFNYLTMFQLVIPEVMFYIGISSIVLQYKQYLLRENKIIKFQFSLD